MASPICLINNLPIPVANTGVTGYVATAGQTVTIALANNAGVNAWNCSCTITDQYNQYSTPALVNSTINQNFLQFSLTFTTPAMDGYAGSSMQWTSTVNPGPQQQSVTFGIFVLCSNG